MDGGHDVSEAKTTGKESKLWTSCDGCRRILERQFSISIRFRPSTLSILPGSIDRSRRDVNKRKRHAVKAQVDPMYPSGV